MSFIIHGTVNPDSKGYSHIISTNCLAELDKSLGIEKYWNGYTEHLFHYDANVTGKPFSMSEASVHTEKWWQELRGSDGVRVMDYRQFETPGKDEDGRTWFMIVTAPTYERDGKFFLLTELKRYERDQALLEQPKVSAEEAMEQILKYSPCPRPNPYHTVVEKDGEMVIKLSEDDDS